MEKNLQELKLQEVTRIDKTGEEITKTYVLHITIY